MDRGRRSAVGALAGAIVALSARVGAQGPERPGPKRIAIPLAPSAEPDPIGPTKKLWAGAFAKHGLIDGKDIEISVYRARSFDQEEWLDFARQVIETRPDLIVSIWIGMLPPLVRHTREIPIVAQVEEEFLELVNIDALSRPGGNVTGISTADAGRVGLEMRLLKDLRPGARRLVVVGGAAMRIKNQPTLQRRWDERNRKVARGLGMDLTPLVFAFDGSADELIGRLRDARAEVVSVGCITATKKREFWQQLVALRIASLTSCPEGVKNGALIGTWSVFNPEDLVRIAAKVLRGESASAIPLEQPREFGLAINLRTANALGISIPPSILVQATQVFE